VNGDFFPTVERELKKVLGPIGQFIVDDKVAELGESKSAFPRHQVRTLVESITGMISDEAKRSQFEMGILEVFLIENSGSRYKLL
jgi:hypothetical protein